MDKLMEEIESILNKTEVKELERTKRFFMQVQAIELPPEEDRAWLSDQFRIYREALKLTRGVDEANRLWPIILFNMGRAYERFDG